MVRVPHLAGMMFILLLGACTHTFEVPQPTFAPVAQADRADAIAVLVVTPELKAAKWSESMMGDTFEAPMGDSMIAGGTKMLSNMFKTVEIEPASGGVPGALWYVAPTMQRIEHTQAAWAFGDQVFTMAVEWPVTDQTGRTLLDDTIISEGRGRQGNVYTYKGDTRAVLAVLMNDAFTKAQAKLASLPQRN